MRSCAILMVCPVVCRLVLAGPVPPHTNTTKTTTTTTLVPDCGHHIAPRVMRPYNATEFELVRRDEEQAAPEPGAKIKIHWMVISQDDSLGGGNIPDDLIQAQVDLLNSDYEQTGFSFELAQIERQLAPELFNTNALSGDPEVQLKATIPTRDITLLKIWSMRPPNGMSYSHFPDEYASRPELDGVMYGVQSIENGQPAHLLSHEVGHWTGLYHTFKGGCDSSGGGDQIDDTPPHENPLDMGGSYMGCDAPVSTCGNGGSDPNDNFMNYQMDACRTSFTAGQLERMKTVMKQYRGLVPAPPPGTDAAPTGNDVTDSQSSEASSTGSVAAMGTDTPTPAGNDVTSDAGVSAPSGAEDGWSPWAPLIKAAVKGGIEIASSVASKLSANLVKRSLSPRPATRASGYAYGPVRRSLPAKFTWVRRSVRNSAVPAPPPNGSSSGYIYEPVKRSVSRNITWVRRSVRDQNSQTTVAAPQAHGPSPRYIYKPVRRSVPRTVTWVRRSVQNAKTNLPNSAPLPGRSPSGYTYEPGRSVPEDVRRNVRDQDAATEPGVAAPPADQPHPSFVYGPAWRAVPGKVSWRRSIQRSESVFVPLHDES